MPLVRDGGRASKACTACRKQKTRCYDSDRGVCLRCHTLRLPCSLNQDLRETPSDSERLRPPKRRRRARAQSAQEDQDDRFFALERTVAAVVRRLEQIESDRPAREASDESPPDVSTTDDEQPPAPIVLLRDVAEHAGISPEQHRAEPVEPSFGAEDPVGRGVISYDTALVLTTIFQEHYGRWTALSSHDDTEGLLLRLRESPLLFCACCLVAARHMNNRLAANLTTPMFQQAKRLLSESMLAIPQGLNFFKAVVILSLWSTTIGASPLSLGWLLSGIALQHSFVSEYFALSRQTPAGQTIGDQDLENQYVWNHLCLSHLHHCVGTRRKAVVDQPQLDHCRLVLASDQITNFEMRIVAELYLYWIMYEHLCVNKVDLLKIQNALKEWKNEWGFLFDQPRATFLQMGLHFAHLVAYDHSLKARTSSARVRESLLSEMVRLSKAIVTLAMDTTDDRTKHLSDHIYHLIAFAAVTICRLLDKYSAQLSTTWNLPELDILVMRLATWLHSIGPACHIAHTFGDIVAASHKKLRPHAQIASPTSSYEGVESSIDADLASLFPDLFPISSGDWPMPDMALDWETLDQEDGIS